MMGLYTLIGIPLIIIGLSVCVFILGYRAGERRGIIETLRATRAAFRGELEASEWIRLGEHVQDAAAYLERNVNDTFINNTLDRYERLIYEMLCIFNPNDDDFATASRKHDKEDQ